jgi:hypothetical protein
MAPFPFLASLSPGLVFSPSPGLVSLSGLRLRSMIPNVICAPHKSPISLSNVVPLCAVMFSPSCLSCVSAALKRCLVVPAPASRRTLALVALACVPVPPIIVRLNLLREDRFFQRAVSPFALPRLVITRSFRASNVPQKVVIMFSPRISCLFPILCKTSFQVAPFVAFRFCHASATPIPS